jgi:hypothetical protein
VKGPILHPGAFRISPPVRRLFPANVYPWVTPRLKTGGSGGERPVRLGKAAMGHQIATLLLYRPSVFGSLMSSFLDAKSRYYGTVTP